MMKNDDKKAEESKVNASLPEADIKEIKPKKVRRKRHFLLYIAIIGFVFYAVITIINQSVEISKKRIELQKLQQQINVVEIQTQYLEKVQHYTGEELEEYIEKIAKEDMGYIGEGERIFINVAGE
ncbi:MAG TPA: hypothetical protein DD413_06755 [Ruminococcus sp.]|nr:hypothetical protein [Ruminococcus sp.]